MDEKKQPMILGSKHTGLAQMIAMSIAMNPTALLGDAIRRQEGRMFEDDPRFNGPEKIPHEMLFLSVGPGALEDKFYAVLMAPSDNIPEGMEVLDTSDNGELVVLARMKMGYDTAVEALEAAGKMMRSVPIFNKGKFWYPFFDPNNVVTPPTVVERRLSEIDLKILQQAQYRRDRRAAKLQRNWDKQHGK